MQSEGSKKQFQSFDFNSTVVKLIPRDVTYEKSMSEFINDSLESDNLNPRFYHKHYSDTIALTIPIAIPHFVQSDTFGPALTRFCSDWFRYSKGPRLEDDHCVDCIQIASYSDYMIRAMRKYMEKHRTLSIIPGIKLDIDEGNRERHAFIKRMHYIYEGVAKELLKSNITKHTAALGIEELHEWRRVIDNAIDNIEDYTIQWMDHRRNYIIATSKRVVNEIVKTTTEKSKIQVEENNKSATRDINVLREALDETRSLERENSKRKDVWTEQQIEVCIKSLWRYGVAVNDDDLDTLLDGERREKLDLLRLCVYKFIQQFESVGDRKNILAVCFRYTMGM